MRRIQIAFCLCAGLVAGLVMAQSEADFQGWMKQIAGSNGKLKGAIKGQDKAAAAAEAKTLETSFKSVEDFWSKRGAADAVNFAKTARTAAASVSAAVTAGDWAKAGTEAGTLGGTCNGCHAAHREGAKGGPYKIK
jgi:cytochrome c556